MTPSEVDTRIIKSRKALNAWRISHAMSGRKDPALVRSVVLTEIGELETLRKDAPPEKQPKIDALMNRYELFLHDVDA